VPDWAFSSAFHWAAVLEDNMAGEPRVVIVGDNASLRFGGEASLPLHHFMELRRLGIEAWLVVHERTRDELSGLLGEDINRVSFIPDRAIHLICWKLSHFLPAQLSYFTLGWISRISTQRISHRLVCALVRIHRVTVVHQPTPVSPREPSLLYNIGAPVIIGPMNGNMTYPPAFRGSVRGQALLSGITGAARCISSLIHWLMPGKIQAQILLVANIRTQDGLPKAARGQVRKLVENSVDLRLWTPCSEKEKDRRGCNFRYAPHFVFMGRLVDWKAVDIAITALARMKHPDATFEIIGDGPMRAALRALGDRLGLVDRLRFSGWLSQADCVARLNAANALLLPSIYECGGAVVLEAMSCGRPVIATAWGGPLDYLDDSCGILVPPTSREAMISGFAAAMDRLAADPDLCRAMGAAGRVRIQRDYSWDGKVEAMLAIYRSAADLHATEMAYMRSEVAVAENVDM
jgi:glycosyltransferase involved in cell wall biosynthesis